MERIRNLLFLAVSLCGIAVAQPVSAQIATTCVDTAEIRAWLDQVDPGVAPRPAMTKASGAEPATETGAAGQGAEGEGCLSCHSNAGYLMGAVTQSEAPPEDGCATAPTRPGFLNSFVRPDFPNSLHGAIGCVNCHGGDDATTDFDAAHANQVDANAICSTCHENIAARHQTSLHGTLNGMAEALRLRSGADNFHTLNPMWEADCATCHAACSDCHLTLPQAVGGGLIRGHDFFATPPMEETCATCHGSRAGGEYLGQHEGLEPDVHFEAGMHCVDCHTNDLHGDGKTYQSRWQVEGRAQCTDCHAGLPNATAMAHQKNHDELSCQTCHSQPYQNCFSCHTGEEDGAYFRRAGDKRLDLKIGRNTDPEYPHGIVTLRNNPVSRDSFDHFGKGLLPHFDDYPTWKTAAPHNIRRVTEQNRSCGACHANPDIFLAPGDLDPDGAAANTEAILKPD
jgi:hypothetical protein